jgi:hypothetical protein
MNKVMGCCILLLVAAFLTGCGARSEKENAHSGFDKPKQADKQ